MEMAYKFGSVLENGIASIDMNFWFWFVIEPETRKIVFFMRSRSGQTWPVIDLCNTKRYGIHHEFVSEDIRNYVERIIETIKDRTI